MKTSILWSEDYKHIKIVKKGESVELRFRDAKTGINYLKQKGIKV